jgi:putative peptide zinc metalloprotease protein
VLIAVIGLLKTPDHARVEGIVEPEELAIIYTAGAGFVEDFLPSGTEVSAHGAPLVTAVNPDLQAEMKSLSAQKRSLEIRRNLAQMRQVAEAQVVEEQLKALDEKITRVKKDLAALQLSPPVSGTWISPDIEFLKGAYLARGERVGTVASLDNVFIRATAGQAIAALLIEHAEKEVQMRVKGRPDMEFAGLIEKIYEAGSEHLPSAALGYAVGGSMPTISQNPEETRSAERFFEIRIKPHTASARLLSGQRVIVRCSMQPKPLAAQWYRSIRQLFQRRFHV